MRVRVYFNSQKREWAVVKVGEGNRKVTFYAPELTLTDATFHTGLKGKNLVCKSGHVNRHDYVEGKLASFSGCSTRLNGPDKALACHMVQKNMYNEFEAWNIQDSDGSGRTHKTAAGGKVIGRVEFTTYGKRYAACDKVLCDPRGMWC